MERRNRVLADKAHALLQLSSENGRADKSGVFLVQARSAMEKVQELMESVELDKLRAAADALARKVVLFGTASGLALVSYFRCMAAMAFDNWRVAGADGGLWATKMARLGSGDVAFVVSTRPPCLAAGKRRWANRSASRSCAFRPAPDCRGPF